MPLSENQTIINGKYRILRLIGEGGMARVWLAEELKFANRQVAIKEPRHAGLRPQDAQEEERRYDQEIEMAAMLEKAHVPQVVRAITLEQEEDGSRLLVMEFAAGGSLSDRLLASPGGLPVEDVLRLAQELGRALKGFHALPIMPVHRDIKPSNILFDSNGSAYLADFGLCQLTGRSGRSQLQGATHPGTPLYMAPEQGSSVTYLTPAADLYSLGCVLFEMLTGKSYKRHRPGTLASSVNPAVPKWLDAVLAKMLAEDPFDRYQSADEMVEALQAGESAAAQELTRQRDQEQRAAQERQQVEEKAKRETEERLRAEEQTRLALAERARRETEDQSRRKAEEQAKREAVENSRLETERVNAIEAERRKAVQAMIEERRRQRASVVQASSTSGSTAPQKESPPSTSRRKFLIAGGIVAVSGIFGYFGWLYNKDLVSPVSPRSTMSAVSSSGTTAVSLSPTPSAAPASTKLPTAITPTATRVPPATNVPALTSFKGNIEMFVQFYTPTTDMTFSENNPLPHNMAQVLATEYTSNHTDVTIEIINKPSQVADHEWIVTGQAGGTIPHICWTHSFWVDSEIDSNWWVPLDPFLSEPNPYAKSDQPGSVRWQDMFYEMPLSTKVAPNGKHYVVPLDLVTTFFFYNKGLFAKAGINAAPETFGEFKAALIALKMAGIIPYNNLGWYESQIGNMLYAKKEREVNPDGGVATLQEVACAIQKGIYRASNPEYAEWMKYAAGIVPYLSLEWTTYADFAAKFNNEELAIYEDGSWRFGYLRANPLITFDWGTFYAPVITPQDNTFATGKAAIPIGGATAAQWALSTRAQKEGLLPLTVDVLHWYSTPENGGRMINECGAFLPNIKGTNISLELIAPLEAISGSLGEASMFNYPDKIDSETREKMTPIWTDYKLGVIQFTEAQARLDTLMGDYAESAIAKNSWSCT